MSPEHGRKLVDVLALNASGKKVIPPRKNMQGPSVGTAGCTDFCYMCDFTITLINMAVNVSKTKFGGFMVINS